MASYSPTSDSSLLAVLAAERTSLLAELHVKKTQLKALQERCSLLEAQSQSDDLEQGTECTEELRSRAEAAEAEAASNAEAARVALARLARAEVQLEALQQGQCMSSLLLATANFEKDSMQLELRKCKADLARLVSLFLSPRGALGGGVAKMRHCQTAP